MAGPIVINARAAARPELGGVERWAREMASRLPALRPGAYEVLRPRPRLVHRLGHAWEQATLPALAAKLDARAILSPANLAPVAWPRNVVVVHDAAALRHPEWYSGTYVAWQKAVLKPVAQRALRVITVSRFSRGELVELLGVPEDRIEVVPGGVGEGFSPEADSVRAARALGLERPYVLTVGSLIARKNLAALEPAAAALRERGVELVAAGGGRPQLRAEGDATGVRALGLVDDDVLPGLYAGASAFVLASRYEGFGLTCIEAMASGVPVVAADAGALPETCGDAALFVDPGDPAAIAEAVARVVDDDVTRRRLTVAGSVRAAALTWDRAARSVDELLQRVTA